MARSTGARGEATLQTADGEVALLFTNRAIAEAEARIGKSIIAIAQGFVDGDSGISELVGLLRAGMEAHRRDARLGGRPVSLPAAYKVLDAVGFAAVTEAVMLAVADVLNYGTEAADPNAVTGGD